MEWKTKYTQLEKQWKQEQQQVQELQDELRDLRFHLSTMETLLNEDKNNASSETGNDSENPNSATTTAEWKGGDVIGMSKPSQRKHHKERALKKKT